ISLQSLRLRVGENRITSMTRKDDMAYVGLGVDGSGAVCGVAKVSLTAMREVDVVEVDNCTADLVSATISADGSYAYFGNAASPAHVYSVRLFPRTSCPFNCSGNGICVEV